MRSAAARFFTLDSVHQKNSHSEGGDLRRGNSSCYTVCGLGDSPPRKLQKGAHAPNSPANANRFNHSVTEEANFTFGAAASGLVETVTHHRGDRGRESCGGKNNGHSQLRSCCSRSWTVPRPVTVKQLREATQQGARARVGQSTLLVDNLPCSTVTLCGRVLYKQDAYENGSFERFLAALPQSSGAASEGACGRQPLLLRSSADTARGNVFGSGPAMPYAGEIRQRNQHPFSLFIITDSTGMVGLLQYHSILYGCADSDMRGAAGDAAPGSNLMKSGDLPTDIDASLVFAGPTTAAAATTAAHGHSTSCTLCTAASSCAFANPHIPAEELDLLRGDYVVATGRLAFGDVEAEVFDNFAAVAPLLAGTAQAPGGEARATGEGEGAFTHVRLPGAEVPVTLTQFRAAFGAEALSALPAGAELCSIAVAAALPAGAGLDSPPLRHSRQALTSLNDGAEETAPLFCIQGRVRLTSSSDEMIYWALSALETHVRLTGKSGGGHLENGGVTHS